ncbi:fumarylacetoacetate hydrolase family protein [Pseudaminobacter sp. NGMCC 1.201702]|uniref:fumarylacetoacetate hydrolase family protein n=1 Tax=Pseudaminobacter sp. NGMCC 1.201702 TaxID=3391825 RepID=UPI0039F0B27C
MYQTMRWIRYSVDNRVGFGTLRDNVIEEYEGDMFGYSTNTGKTIGLYSVKVETPCVPSKMIALWNNSRAVASAQNLEVPTEPLFFLKPPNCFLAHDAVLKTPISGASRVLYEGELGIVIGKSCKDISHEDAGLAIFGYTCVNDLTALSLLQAEAGFMHWSRAKGLDGFGPFGPVIATGLDPSGLVVRTHVNGRQRQSYSASDFILKPDAIVSLVSRGMTLLPGDVIACGTSTGAGPIPKEGAVDVEIDGIGVLRTHFRGVREDNPT